MRRNWEDILRVTASIHTGAVRAHDVIRMLSRDDHPTPLGEAITHYGRIYKTLHVLRLVNDTGYRRDIKAQPNLQESRHALARRIFHGQRGELRQRYYEGMEDQLGALGLILNAIVLFTPATSTPPSPNSVPASTAVLCHVPVLRRMMVATVINRLRASRRRD